MEKSFYQYCIENEREDLLEEWDSSKNRNETPQNVSYFSSKKIWWKCSRGHEWITPVKVRAHGSNCPFCSNKRVASNENDLVASHPELIREWNYDKNTGVNPREISAGSKKSVWWRCPYGHEWKALIVSRSTGRGCPVCSGKIVIPGENDLMTHIPAIAAQWHPTLNGDLTPAQTTPFSNREVWWQCELGHAWKARISTRTKQDSGCPYCTRRILLKGFNDLETTDPKIASEWHPFLNGKLMPCDVMSGSKKKVWWKCLGGHIWKAYVFSRKGNGTGCPVCAGKNDVPSYYIDPSEFEKRMLDEMKKDKEA